MLTISIARMFLLGLGCTSASEVDGGSEATKELVRSESALPALASAGTYQAEPFVRELLKSCLILVRR